MQKFLPQLLTFFTGHARQKVDIEWNSGLWVDKIFRLWELVFWRKHEIRAEMSVAYTHADGVIKVYRKFFTLEAFLVHCEGTIRSYFKRATWNLAWRQLPQGLPRITYATVALAGLVIAFKTRTDGILLPLFGMTVAYDTSGYQQTTASGGNGTKTFTLTSITIGSGSERFMAAVDHSDFTGSQGNDDLTWNAVSATKIGDSGTFQSVSIASAWYLINPASGNQNLVATVSGYNTANGNGFDMAASFYTGVKQTSPLDGTPDFSRGVGSTHTMNVTTSNAGSWAIVVGAGINSAMSANSVVTTDRVAPGSGAYQPYIGDSNGGLSAGAKSIVVNGSGVWGQAWFGFAFKLSSNQFTLTCAQGSFTMTGQALLFKRTIRAVLAQGSFTMTGFALAFKRNYQAALSTGYFTLTGMATRLFWRTWNLVTKHSTSWSQGGKHNTTWTSPPKDP